MVTFVQYSDRKFIHVRMPMVNNRKTLVSHIILTYNAGNIMMW